MSKRNDSIEKLKKAFEDNTSLSISDICTLLNLNSRQSAYNYLSKLQNAGVSITSVSSKHQKYYSISPSSHDTQNFHLADNDSIRKFLLLFQLRNNGPMTIQDLYTSISKFDTEYDLDFVIDIKKTTLYRLIKELKKSGKIISTKHTDKSVTYSLLEENASFGNYDTIQKNLEKLISELQHLPTQHPYFLQLNNAYKKISIILGNVDTTITNENYIIYGKQYITATNLYTEYQRLNHIPYTTHNLEITYSTKRSIRRKLIFAVGLLVYSVNQDQLYLVGESIQNGRTAYRTIIKLSSVENISVLPDKNKIYGSKFFQELSECMLGVSTEEPTEICVEIDNVSDYLNILKTFCAHRKYANISINSDKITLSDKVSGLDEFTHYLRQFEDHCRILKPQILKDKMQFSIHRSLMKYEEFLNE